MASNTYVALDTKVLGTAAASVTFTSIPQGYTDLVVVFNGSTTSGNLVKVQFNGDTTDSNYSSTLMWGNGSSASTSRYSVGWTFVIPDAGNAMQNVLVNVMNYSNSTTYKTYLARANQPGASVTAAVGMWRNSAAITSLTLAVSGNEFTTGSTFTLYGIAAELNSSSTATPPISGYSLWLDGADDSSFTYSSGTLVSQWSDKSGNSRHFTQATTANQPNRISTIRQNNYPVVQFWKGGADTFRWLEKTSYDWAASANTVFLVMKGNTGTGYYQAAFAAKTTQGLSYAISGGGGYQYAIFKSDIAPYVYDLVPTVGNADVAVWKSAGISAGSATVSFYKNGTAASSTQTASGLSTSTTAQLGANNANESIYGYICEVLVYPSQLSDGDRNSVEAYLKSKWGIA